jgi:hypothetical protein
MKSPFQEQGENNMPVVITTNKKSLNIEDISLNLTCPECKSRYNFQIKKPQEMKNCRCGKGTFYIDITPMKGRISVLVMFQHASDLSEEEIFLRREGDVEIA